MPIQIQPITKLDLLQIKTAIEKIAREAQAVQNTSGQKDNIYTDVAPTVDSIAEGQEVYYVNGATIRKYTKINGAIRYWNLT